MGVTAMLAQVIAICIFLGMFLLIILDQFERHVITLVSGALVLILVFGVCMHSTGPQSSSSRV